jgi:hypothetical protein
MIPAQTYLAETATDTDILKEIIHNSMTGDLYFHHCMHEALSAAGFDLRTVQQHWYHHIYEIKMRRGTFDLDKNDTQAARQVRRVLKKAKLYIEPDAINITQYGSDRLRLVFVFPFGAEGTLRVGR